MHLKDYPLILITGARIRPFFHSDFRQFGAGFREQQPDPVTEIHPNTAKKNGITDGQWIWIESPRGNIKQRARITTAVHPMVVSVQSHWWFPEKPGEEPSLHGLSGALDKLPDFSFNKTTIQASALRFSRESFKKKASSYFDEKWIEHLSER